VILDEKILYVAMMQHIAW